MPVPTKRTLPGVAVFAVAVVLAVVLAAVIVWDVATRPDGSTQRTLLGWAVTGAGCGSLYWLRGRPVPVAVFTLLCTAVYFPVAYRDLPLLLLTFVISLFMVVAEGHLTADRYGRPASARRPTHSRGRVSLP